MNIKSKLSHYLQEFGLALWISVSLPLFVAGQTSDHLLSDVQPTPETLTITELSEQTIVRPLTLIWRIQELSKGALPEPPLSDAAQALNDLSDVAKALNDLNDPMPKPPVMPTASDPLADPQPESQQRFDWSAALKQSFFFNSFLQGFRVATEPKVRAELGGPFFKDYWRSIKSLRGWDDGDNFLTNYIGHPMQGAVSGRIQIHNDPKSLTQEFHLRREYFKSRFKAMGFAALFSCVFR